MALHSERQRFQTAQHKKTVERAGDCADRVLQECNLIGEFLVVAGYDYSAYQIGMTVQILCRRMHHDVESGLNRALNPRRCKCVIAN
jgi:hypothetical protein